MQRILIALLVLCLLPFVGSQIASAHCQVPCGIFADQARFEAMLEDATTIEKAQRLMGELAGKNDAQSMNQYVRWVKTKEEHAANTQKVIADYFMAQRIKPAQDTYVDRLMASHAVMIAAMKCKQSADAATAEALKTAILAFHKVYEPDAAKKSHDHGKDK